MYVRTYAHINARTRWFPRPAAFRLIRGAERLQGVQGSLSINQANSLSIFQASRHPTSKTLGKTDFPRMPAGGVGI